MSIRRLQDLSLGVLLVFFSVAAVAQDWKGRGRLNGEVLDESGAGIAGATVTLHPANRPDIGPPPLTTDKKGKWGLLGLSGGAWTISLEAPGFVGAEGSVNVNEFGVVPPVRITLRKADAAAASAAADAAPKGPDAKSILMSGNDLLAQGKPAEARAEYEKALGMLDVQFQPMVNRAIGQTYLAEKNWGAAINAFQTAITGDPNDGASAQLLAKAYADQGKNDQAIDALKVFFDGHPEDVATLQLLIGLLVADKREAEAATYQAKLPAGAQVDVNTLMNMGINLYNSNKLPEAFAKFDAAVQAKPELPDGYYYRGLVHLALGHSKEAKADFQKVLALDPNHPNAADCREFLKSL
ncbi:MAG: tetratricopeptide repeat protein [Thermoanaerobaculia bacterium]